MPSESMGILLTWGPAVFMIILLYIFLLRPQKMEQQRRRSMLDNLKVGDNIMTVGGIYGKIKELHERDIKLEIADHTVIKITRSAVNANITQEENQNLSS